ncbi:branched-chain amino acid ABC transporter substrate-binding protein [Streptomyces sp. HSW2009]|uniref:branched-chain amino acid ABC transporter substrate-binding protein n=1 Tax=Streptomyces sp. HSW2009 TaxID=3142890 RepID=UPI0032EACF12
MTAAASGASAGDGGAAGGGRPRRRRLLAVAGGAALAVGAGVGGWAVLRDSDDSDGGAGGADGAGGDRARASNGLPIFRIGLHAALTGPYAARGEAQRTGALLAVEQFNARRGRPFEAGLRSADDGGRPQRSAAAARSLVADPSVLAVVGPSTDATADPAGPIYEAPSLAGLAVSFSKFVVPGDSIDGTLLYARPASGGELGPFPIYLRKETKAKTAAVIYDRHLDDYGRWATKAAVKLLPLADFTPVPRVLPMLVGDYRPLVRELLDRKVGAVVYMGGPHGAAEVAKELDRNGFSGPRVAGEPALDPQFLTEAGDAANGWMVNASFIDATVKPEAARFAAAYRKRFGKQPPYHAAEAYDVVQLILRTLTELATGAAAGTAPSGSPSPSGGTGSGPAGGASSAGRGASSAGARRVRTPQRKQVLDRLRTARYRGVAKEIAFSKEFGQYEPNEGSFLYRVERGRFRYVGNAWDV